MAVAQLKGPTPPSPSNSRSSIFKLSKAKRIEISQIDAAIEVCCASSSKSNLYDLCEHELEGMNCLTPVTRIGVGVRVGVGIVEAKQTKCVVAMAMVVSMRDRSKNRKPLQKGRSLSIEAIQTVQALKRAAKLSHSSLQEAFAAKFRRLLKSDMIAVLRELLRQNQCLLALKVFEDVRKEEWYRPKLFLYAEMVAALGSNGLLQQVQELIRELKAETALTPDLQGFNALMESLMSLNLTGLAVECYHLMRSVACDPDKLSFKILIDGLRSNGEMELSTVVEQDAQSYYGPFWDLSEAELSSEIKATN